jgi:heme/copper-type cytochrome/quinol oxidase subunit 4
MVFFRNMCKNQDQENIHQENIQGNNNTYYGKNALDTPLINADGMENSSLDFQANTNKPVKIMQYSGCFMSISTILLIYSSNPERTPIVFQLILNGLNIVVSFIFTRYYLKKNVTYNTTYCCWSIVALILSIVLSLIPIDLPDFDSVIWPVVFLVSQITRVFGYILQEEYFIFTNDRSNGNKFYNITYTRFIQLIVTLALFWLDLFVGYEKSFNPLKESFKTIVEFDMNFILLELFVISTIIFCVVSGYLNSISTNYSSVALTLVTPVVGVFFSLFPSLNDGEKYPLYITIPSLILNLISSVLWMKGEVH